MERIKDFFTLETSYFSTFLSLTVVISFLILLLSLVAFDDDIGKDNVNIRNYEKNIVLNGENRTILISIKQKEGNDETYEVKLK